MIVSVQQLITKIKKGEEVDYRELRYLKMSEQDIVYIIEKLKYTDKKFMMHIARYQKLSDEFILKYYNLLNKYYISNSQRNLKMDTIEKIFKDCNNINIFKYQKLTKEFIENNIAEFGEDGISILSENRECKMEDMECILESKAVNWLAISYREDLSEDFINKYFDKLNIGALYTNDNYRNILKNKLDKIEFDFYENLFIECESNMNLFFEQIYILSIVNPEDKYYKRLKEIPYRNIRIIDSIMIQYMDTFNKEQLEEIIKIQCLKDETIKIIEDKIKTM